MYRNDDDYLIHYGMPKRSGRYPWGSGDDPYQRSGDFLARIDSLKKEGLNETQIASKIGLSTTQYRAQKKLAKDERRNEEVATARGLREKGYSLQAIANKMGYANDSSVRSLLDNDSEARMKKAQTVANFLKEQIDKKGMIDVGTGVERELNISREKLKQSLEILEMQGYKVYGGGVPQVNNPGKQTNIKVAGPKDMEHKDIYDFEKVNSLRDYRSRDNGLTFETFQYPSSINSKRIKIKYAEEGGIEKDGLIELRRGVDDISLGSSKYAQVRIMVDGTHYIKGMAVYSDDLPKGVDIQFNTNKKIGTPQEKVLKPIKDDPDNPFGSLIKAQRYYDDPNGKYVDPVTGKKQSLSPVNKAREEGDWNEWSRKLPSQFLSKQNISLIKKQLGLTYDDKESELNEILSLNNPTVKKTLLKSFADDCDAASVHLKAAALPGQRFQVILPVPSLKDNEVYAPNFENGTKLALVRFPHGGTFEIPILTVNNKHADSKKMMGSNPLDAIGINSKVAERLSGADFDGDTVMCVPTGKTVHISSKNPLKGLEGFDPKDTYGAHDIVVDKKTGKSHYYQNGKEYKIMNNTQTEMGKASNLISDMTLKGATDDEIARAVRHSMVVIDAEKHKLNYKASFTDNAIASLKKKYQGTIDENGKYSEGASTLISRAKSEIDVLKRKGSPIIDPNTGEVSYKTVTETYIDKDTGKEKTRMIKSTQMAETKDAFTLVSQANTPPERAYAEYANKMKAMANRARKEMMSAGKIEYSADAKKKYQQEVDYLNSSLNIALKNAPRERQAQIMANAIVAAKKQQNPDMTKSDIKKEGQRALTNARITVGAKRELIKITDKSWEAIQAGAISETVLSKILNNTDIDEVRQRATPRTSTTISTAKQNKIASMKALGYSNAEIARSIGVSTSTVTNYLK